MNLVNLFNDAWKARSDNTHEQAEVMFKNLLSHGFVDMERVLRANVPNYDENLFYMVQKLLACIVMADGDSFVGETDAYEKYCRWAGFQPLTPSQLAELDRRTSMDELKSIIEVIKICRKYIDEDNYRCFVLSLCYMSLFGDKAVDENEYYIIAALCDPSRDYVPSWAQFKREF